MSFKYFSVLMPHGALDGALSPVELVGKIKPGSRGSLITLMHVLKQKDSEHELGLCPGLTKASY